MAVLIGVVVNVNMTVWLPESSVVVITIGILLKIVDRDGSGAGVPGKTGVTGFSFGGGLLCGRLFGPVGS